MVFPLPPAGFELRVTSALPFMARNEAGENIGPCHWFPMYDYIWVSQELYDQLRQMPQQENPAHDS